MDTASTRLEHYLVRLGLDDRPWRGALVDDLLLPVDDVTDAERHALWRRTQDSHRAWDEAGRP